MQYGPTCSSGPLGGDAQALARTPAANGSRNMVVTATAGPGVDHGRSLAHICTETRLLPPRRFEARGRSRAAPRCTRLHKAAREQPLRHVACDASRGVVYPAHSMDSQMGVGDPLARQSRGSLCRCQWSSVATVPHATRPWGVLSQVAAQMALEDLGGMIFFVDPLSAHPHQVRPLRGPSTPMCAVQALPGTRVPAGIRGLLFQER